MRTIVSTLAVLALAALVVFAQDKGAKGGGAKGAKQPPKNLKVLTPENYFAAMQSFVPALGLADKGGCNFCHEMDRSLDTKEEKVMARKMIQMVMDINKNTFNGEAKVTCFTCHRGQEHPVSAP